VRKQPVEVPMLQFGQPNSFYAFKEAISKAAVEQYGHDGTLFETGVLYKPEHPNRVDYEGDEDDDEKCDEILYFKDCRAYARKVYESKAVAPKIYGYVWKFLSVESQDEVKHQTDYVKFNADKDPERLLAAIVKTHEVNRLSKIPEVLKMAARNEYRACKQGGFESLITSRERFDAATKSYKDQGNANMTDQDVAMDVWHGLDPGRYSQFKTDIQNGMTAGSIKAEKALKDVNKVYTLAANWI
jgi:hypothetical protein